MQPVFDEPVGNFEKHVKTFPDASKIVDLIGRAPLGSDVYLFDRNKANMGVRWVHITTRNGTPRKSSPTPINTCKR